MINIILNLYYSGKIHIEFRPFQISIDARKVNFKNISANIIFNGEKNYNNIENEADF